MFRRTLFAITAVTALAGSLLMPSSAQAAGVTVRVYDRSHKDYHRWDRDEDHHYRAYLTERHRRYLAFQRASRQRQREYWRWRHNHDDAILQLDIH